MLICKIQNAVIKLRNYHKCIINKLDLVILRLFQIIVGQDLFIRGMGLNI